MYVVVLFLFEMQRYKKLLYIRCYSDKKYYLCSMLENKDYTQDEMEACYIVFNGEAVVVNAKEQTRREIEFVINELKP